MNRSGDIAPLSRERAEIVALHALGWVARSEDVSSRFMAATGISAAEMRLRARDPEFLGFVLDFLLSEETALMEFAQDVQVPADHPMRARAALPGGDLPEWT